MARKAPAGTKGVYTIRDGDGRAYVGGSTNIAQRWREHRSMLRRGIHRNRDLQAAWLERGEQDFTFTVVELVGDEPLLVAEQRWIDRLSIEAGIYNLSPTAGSSLGTKMPDAMRAKMSARTAGEKHPLAKLSAKDIPVIRALVADGVVHRIIAERFNVSRSAIVSIATGRTWASLNEMAVS